MTRSILAMAALGLVVARAQAATPTPVPSPGTALGEGIYAHWCASCHAPGPGHPGTESLKIKYADKLPAVLLERTDLTPQVVSKFVRQGVLLMAPFRKTEIPDAELAALSSYVAGNFKKPR